MPVFLVTGGAGFIGSHIAETLARGGNCVRVFDNFSTGCRENVQDVVKETEGKIEIIEGDIRDVRLLQSSMRGTDYVIHQAALPSVPRSIADPLKTNEVNVLGTLNVLIAAREVGVKRVVFASSSSVYGNSGTLPKDEEMKVSPLSPYAVSKLSAESYCIAFQKVYGLPAVVLRYFNVYGPRQDPTSQYSAVIPKFIHALLQSKSPIIFGGGQQSRDFTFVGNVVNANLLACQFDSAVGHIMNVGTCERHTLLDLHRNLIELMGIKTEPKFAPARAGDVEHSFANIDKAAKLLQYRPIVGWKEGLRKTIAWYRDKYST